MPIYGVDSIVTILSHIMFIYLTFWALQSLRLDQLFKKGNQFEKQRKTVYLLLSISIGFAASNFFMEIIFLTRNLFLGLF